MREVVQDGHGPVEPDAGKDNQRHDRGIPTGAPQVNRRQQRRHDEQRGSGGGERGVADVWREGRLARPREALHRGQRRMPLLNAGRNEGRGERLGDILKSDYA